jgi:hypothetical protein
VHPSTREKCPKFLIKVPIFQRNIVKHFKWWICNGSEEVENVKSLSIDTQTDRWAPDTFRSEKFTSALGICI